MTRTVILIAIGVCIIAAIVVSLMRKNKGTLTLLLDSTQLSEHETVTGNVQLSLNQESKTEELVVKLECIETIQYVKNGEEKTESSTVFENLSTLVGSTDHPSGHSELFPFEFTIPNSVDTTDLADFYRQKYADEGGIKQHISHGHPSSNRYNQHNNSHQASNYHQHSYAQQPNYGPPSQYGPNAGYGVHPVNPHAQNTFLTSELRWQISTHLRSAGLDLHDKKQITLNVPSNLHLNGAYQY